MYGKCRALLLAVVAAMVPTSASADTAKGSRGQDRQSPYMRIYGSTLPPFGWVRFCERFRAECVRGGFEDVRFEPGGQRFAELDRINRQVNKAIEPVTDLELYGETEHWTIPTSRGDCEDYALLKRRMLISLGWPVGSLLMTVVRDEKGEGHAVLMARTAQGDFVLDNKVDDIKPWYATPYSFVMRQSYIDPNVWVSLDPKDAQSPALMSGMRSAR